MAKRQSRIKLLLISSSKGYDFLQPILKQILLKIDSEIQLDLYSQFERNAIVQRQRDKDLTGGLISSDLILVDLDRTTPTMFFEIGIARSIGKPIIYIAEKTIFLEDLPDFIRQSYFIIYEKKEALHEKLKEFFDEYIENPKRFASRPIIESDTSSQLVVDLEKLDPREFENLCFELLSRLGYKQLEWKVKDEFVDAVSTLHRKDPDGFEYDEYWLISFGNEYRSKDMVEIALHDPEYFSHRIFRNIFERGMIEGGRIAGGADAAPVTLLFILKGNNSFPKKLIKDLSRRDFKINRRGYPLTFRIRWWDENDITTLVQSHASLARKYFSSEALARSGVRLSYEELYKQYADMNDELQRINEAYKSERDRVELLERDAAWKLLSFTAAHRMGNPIDAIDSELSNLKSAIAMKRTDMIEAIVKSMELPVEKAKSIVSQFRNLSIAHEVTPETVKSEKLNEILKNSAKQAIDKKVHVDFDLKKIPDIAIDVQKIAECFEELVRNSLHFVKGDDQRISISVAVVKSADLPDKMDRTREYVKITFGDNGCGVPYEKKTEIFKPFERSYIHGTGLGLAFCEIIIEKHGGKIRESGKPNEGAIFEIFLPTTNKIANK